MFGGPLVNKLGTKWALVIGACSFPIRGSSYYCNSKFGNQWYLILGESSGVGTGVLGQSLTSRRLLYRYRKWMLVVNIPFPLLTQREPRLILSVAEAGSIMSLAPSGARGKYLALWIVARNVGYITP
jgi:hypothetical protein